MKKDKLLRALVWMLFFQILVILIGILPLELNNARRLDLIITINVGLIVGTVGNIITLQKVDFK